MKRCVPATPGEYPTEAVELTVTFLLPVTEENRSEVDGAISDALDESGVTWWTERIGHFVENRQVVSYSFKRPEAFKRPRPKKAKP